METAKITIVNNDDAPTVGTAVIPAGKTSVTVETEAVSEDSRILVTFTSDLKGRSFYVSDRNDGSFTVNISRTFTTDESTFDWWVVNADVPSDMFSKDSDDSSSESGDSAVIVDESGDNYDDESGTDDNGGTDDSVDTDAVDVTGDSVEGDSDSSAESGV